MAAAYKQDGQEGRKRKWTAEKVIAGLKAFYGPSVDGPDHPDPPSLEVANPPLIGGARRVFGSLKAAMGAAGLPYPPRPPTPWTEQAILDALRRMHAEGRDLSLAAVKDRSNGSLLGPALHRFGSWRKAVEAAGLDYAAVARIKEWTRDDVLRELRWRNEAGLDMGGGALQKQDVRLWAATKRYFGSYLGALEAAGLPVPQPVPGWTWAAPRLRQALRELHEAGVDLSSGHIRQTHPGLFFAARARLGSWREAVESIGLDYQSVCRCREWSRQAVIDRIRELHAAGADLRAGVVQKSDIPLSGAAQRYFGGMRRALEAAGIPYPQSRSGPAGSGAPSYWTEELVLQTLRELHAVGHDLRYTPMKRKSQPLFYAAKQLFGSYVNAVRQAGIDYTQMSQAQLARERERRCREAGATPRGSDPAGPPTSSTA